MPQRHLRAPEHLYLLYTEFPKWNNIVPGGKAGEVPSGGFVPSFDGLGRFLGLSDDLGQIFYNSAKIATKEVFLNP
jgi:hypothetical protein